MAVFGTRAAVLRMATQAVPATFADYTADSADIRIKTEESDSDFTSFVDAAAGGARKYTLAVTLRQDNAVTSLWYKAWNETGQTAPYEFWPMGRPGSGTATPAQPKYTGSVVITEPDGDFVGGEANKSTTAVFTTEIEWVCTAKPVLGIA
jgi:hypothetical protein